MRTRRNALGRQILELGGPIRCSAQTLSLNTSSHLSWWRHAAVGNGIAHRLLSDDAIAIKWWLRSARRVSVSALRRDRRARESLAAAAPETVPTQKRCMHTLILRNVTQQFIGEHCLNGRQGVERPGVHRLLQARALQAYLEDKLRG